MYWFLLAVGLSLLAGYFHGVGRYETGYDEGSAYGHRLKIAETEIAREAALRAENLAYRNALRNLLIDQGYGETAVSDMMLLYAAGMASAAKDLIENYDRDGYLQPRHVRGTA